MAESSFRAARSERKGGLANALFLVAAAELPPPELIGVADQVTIAFPWGSLLRGALACPDAARASAGIAALVRPGGGATIHLSVTARDRLDLPILDDDAAPELTERWRRHGLELSAWRRATADEIAATRSSWARRLRAGSDRAVWRLELTRPIGRSV